MLKLLLVAISFLLASIAVSAAVYVWRDAQGLLGGDTSISGGTTVAGGDTSTPGGTTAAGGVAAGKCANPPRGYEGFGRNTTGGAGQPVYRVINRNDSGAGSLRDAISQGNRCVVFDVGGDIALASILPIKGANVTIDGFTAPSPGITLRNHALEISGINWGANNIIVRGIRSRDANRTSYHGDEDGLTVHHTSNVVIDHVSVAGFGDGAIDISDYTRDVTVQWSIFAEGSWKSNKANLIKYWTTRISIHHNLYINASDRNPYVAWSDNAAETPSEIVADVRNNLVWNHGWSGISVRHRGWANVVNNYVLPQPYIATKPDGALFVPSSEGGIAYASGNYNPNGLNIDAMRNRTTPFAAIVPTTTDAITAAYQVVAQAGARGPRFGLDAFDLGRISQISLVPAPSL